jgi:CTP-dependent riboflavin kinase
VTILRGRVTSGIGDLTQWMIKYGDLYEQCTGVRLYPGSLNVPPLRLPPAALGGRVGMNIVPCRFMGLPAFILRTDQNEAGTGNHDRKVVEIGAAVRLRDRFDLADGDVVTIQIDQ